MARTRAITFENAANKIGNVCLYAFLFLTTYIFLYRYDHTMFIVRYVFLISGAIIGYIKCLVGKWRPWQIIIFAFGVFCAWILTYLAQFVAQNSYNNYSPSDFLYTMCYIGISIVILENKYSHRISLGLYAFTSVSILVRILQGVDKNRILLANSRNFISVLLLSTMLLYYISCHDKRKSILITPAIIYFYINLYATGRSGIIVSGFLLVALLLYKYTNIRKKELKALMGLLITVVLVIVAVYVFQINETIIPAFLNRNFSAFLSRGIDSNGRSEIWSIFIKNNLSGIEPFLFASDASLAMPDGNLHNSFLQSYASFGFIGFVTLIVLVVKSILEGMRRKDYLWLILFAGLLLRVITDKVFFQGYCEPYLYYFLFYYVYQRMKKYRR